MIEIVLPDILVLILFIVPGYLTVYFISIITDYLHEKGNLEKATQYLLFSAVSYFLVIFIISIFSLGLYWIYGISLESSYSFILEYPLVLTGFAIFISPFFGIFLGYKYFGKGYPHSHFKKITNKTNFPSIYSKMFKEFKEGCWVTCDMKSGEKIQGILCDYDFDEETKQYKLSLKNAMRISNGKEMNLVADKVVIDISNCNFIQFKK